MPLFVDVDPLLQAKRLTRIAEVYRTFSPREILCAVPARLQGMIDGIPQAADGGAMGIRALMVQGELDASRTALRGLMGRMPVFFWHRSQVAARSATGPRLPSKTGRR